MSEHVWLPSFGFPLESNEAFESLNVESIVHSNKCFWGLKQIRKILQNMPSHTLKKQVKIVITTMALHNYIRGHSQNHDHFDETMDKLNHNNSEHISYIASPTKSYDTVDNITQDKIIFRDGVAASLMEA